jgi:hypothetical protein
MTPAEDTRRRQAAARFRRLPSSRRLATAVGALRFARQLGADIRAPLREILLKTDRKFASLDRSAHELGAFDPADPDAAIDALYRDLRALPESPPDNPRRVSLLDRILRLEEDSARRFEQRFEASRALRRQERAEAIRKADEILARYEDPPDENGAAGRAR